MRRTDTLIAGGGPAGSAAAILLARAGTRPLLIERSREARDVVCGGFLGWDALAALERLGIDVSALGARPIRKLRLHARGRQAEAPLPHRAAGLSRRALDEALLNHAAAAGAAIERGVAIRSAENRRLQLADGAGLEGGALFLATGKHELRGLARPRSASGWNPAIGLRVGLAPSAALAQALDGVIELHLFDCGYAGLLLQEDGSANLCLSVATSRLAEGGGKPEALLACLAAEAPALAGRLAAGSAGEWVAVSRVPYGWRTAETLPGIFRLGDQAAVIASLAGDGIAIALGSGRMAAEHYLRGGADAATRYQRSFARRAARPLRFAGALRALAEDRLIAPPLLGLLAQVPQIPGLLARLTRIGS